MVKKFDVFYYNTGKSEKPCVVISPDEMNDLLPYVLVAPITKLQRNFPCRLGLKIKGVPAQVALDLIRSVSKEHLIHKAGVLPDNLKHELLDILKNLFWEKL